MHGNLKEMKERLKGTLKVLQVTQALEHISAVRLLKSRGLLGAHEPYTRRLGGVINALRISPEQPTHALCVARSPGRPALVAFGSDRGLCGGYNSALADRARAFVAESGASVSLVVVGQVLGSRLRRAGCSVEECLPQPPLRDYTQPLANLAKDLSAGFRGGRYRDVHALCTPFIPGRPSLPQITSLLPMDPSAADSVLMTAGDDGALAEATVLGAALTEPGAETLLRQLVPEYLRTRLIHLFLHSVASEQNARHIAMVRARDNARDMADELTLACNRLRQEQITTEMTELATGVD